MLSSLVVVSIIVIYNLLLLGTRSPESVYCSPAGSSMHTETSELVYTAPEAPTSPSQSRSRSLNPPQNPSPPGSPMDTATSEPIYTAPEAPTEPLLLGPAAFAGSPESSSIRPQSQRFPQHLFGNQRSPGPQEWGGPQRLPFPHHFYSPHPHPHPYPHPYYGQWYYPYQQPFAQRSTSEVAVQTDATPVQAAETHNVCPRCAQRTESHADFAYRSEPPPSMVSRPADARGRAPSSTVTSLMDIELQSVRPRVIPRTVSRPADAEKDTEPLRRRTNRPREHDFGEKPIKGQHERKRHRQRDSSEHPPQKERRQEQLLCRTVHLTSPTEHTSVSYQERAPTGGVLAGVRTDPQPGSRCPIRGCPFIPTRDSSQIKHFFK